MKIQEVLNEFLKYGKDSDIDLIQKAYTYTRDKHKGQTRASGEPYLNHLLNVALIAAKLKLDPHSIAASLLHDVVEDTQITLEELESLFGSEIVSLVDGVTKLSQIRFNSKAEAQAENFRKMLLAMAKDIRVLLIKLCDRLHNMRTLEFLPDSKKARIAQETIEIYAPLAHRLGIYWIKSDLEDLAFQHLKPELYQSIKEKISQSKKEREKYTEETINLLNKELSIYNLKADITGRSKHFYSIYQKMEKRQIEFNEIYDLLAFRIIVDTKLECYTALGAIHSAWKPIPGRFKDYIAIPKPNRYQSLHTSVIGPKGHRIEIQIRTREMHEIAESGIAAHWQYKEDKNTSSIRQQATEEFKWLRNLIEAEKNNEDSFEFITNIKDDLFAREVYCFSPKGDLLALPSGSTPIDFAYHVHTEVGNKCSGARVNGQHVPLNYRLRNGDTVEIITLERQHPGKDWLKIAVSSKAKQRIRSYIRTQEREHSVRIGQELLTKDLRKIKESFSKLYKSGEIDKASSALGFNNTELMLAELGYGKINSTTIIRKLLPNAPEKLDEKLTEEDGAIARIFSKAAAVFREKEPLITVSGRNDDFFYRFARCCEPLPGDELVGYVSHGRGMIIHKRGCQQTLGFDPRRLLAVAWNENIKTKRPITIQVYTLDELGILANMTQCISSRSANILSANVAATTNGTAITTFEISIENSAQMHDIIRALETLKGVIKVERKSS